jgi:hypothetical protein
MPVCATPAIGILTCRCIQDGERRKIKHHPVTREATRKTREKGEGSPTTGAATATDTNPVVMFIVRLLTAASVADDRINFTCRTSSQNNLGTARGPIRFELVRRCGKWDKNNRSSLELCPTGVDLPRSEPEAELLPPEIKIQLEENNPSGLQLLGV